MATSEVLKRRNRQSEMIRKMVVAGMLSAVTAVLVFTPIGMIPLPPPLLSATTVHVPVILAALAEGQDWDTLAEAHNDDPGMKAGAVNAATGYPVCEGFTQFDAAFVEGAMALQNVGDYSDKIEGSYGYYIIQYTSDVVEGAVDMETVHDTISSSLLSSKQSTVRDEVVAQWVKDANATINKDILND